MPTISEEKWSYRETETSQKVVTQHYGATNQAISLFVSHLELLASTFLLLDRLPPLTMPPLPWYWQCAAGLAGVLAAAVRSMSSYLGTVVGGRRG